MTPEFPAIPGVSFKFIPGYRWYCAADNGSIWSCRAKGPRSRHRVRDAWKMLRPSLVRGYPYVRPYGPDGDRMIAVHRLVMLAFVGAPPEGMEVCHNDGNRLNCHLSNLRYDLRVNNNADKIAHGTWQDGERNGRAKLTASQVAEMRRRMEAGESRKSVATAFGVSPPMASYIAIGKNWKDTPVARSVSDLARGLDEALNGGGRGEAKQP